MRFKYFKVVLFFTAFFPFMANAGIVDMLFGKSDSHDLPSVDNSASKQNNLSGIWRIATTDLFGNDKTYWIINDQNGIITFRVYYINDLLIKMKAEPLQYKIYAIKAFHSDGNIYIDYSFQDDGDEYSLYKVVYNSISVRAHIDNNGNIVGSKEGTSMMEMRDGTIRNTNIPKDDFFATKVTQIGD